MRALQRCAAAAVLLAALAALPAADAQSAQGSQAVVLFHHPYDKVDPFGVPYEGRDTFAARHAGLSRGGVFDFPTFVVDGVRSVPSLPDPNLPYASTVANYTALVRERLGAPSPGTLAVRGTVDGSSLAVAVRFEPSAPLSDPGHPEALHLMAAVLEDFIHYQPEAPISNGITEHRLTVRALQDLGAVDLSSGQPAAKEWTLPLPAAWRRDQLVVATWLEAQAPFGRFGAGESLQAAWARANGTEVVQEQKAVLAEVYSATWCAPCLYGDLAAAEVAETFGAAARQPPPAGPRYFRMPDVPGAAGIAGVVACLALVVWSRRAP